jgi:cytochrome c biogenesis protein CcmG, thiol:disulfide interchange protein DsbE
VKRLTYCALVALTLTSCTHQSSDTEARWPSVIVVDSSGTELNTSDLLNGNRLVVSLWSTWCVPCRRELPQLQQFAVEHQDVSVVAVNLGDKLDSVAAYADEIGLTMPVVIDSEGRISSALGVTSVPSTIVIDSHGKVIATHVGEITANELAVLVETSS